MRTIKIPEDIDTKDLPGVRVEKFSFDNFFMEFVAPGFPRGTADQIALLQSVATKLGDCLPFDILKDQAGKVELADDEHAALHAAMPVVQGKMLIRMLSFYSAVASAEKTADNAPTPAPKEAAH